MQHACSRCSGDGEQEAQRQEAINAGNLCLHGVEAQCLGHEDLQYILLVRLFGQGLRVVSLLNAVRGGCPPKRKGSKERAVAQHQLLVSGHGHWRLSSLGKCFDHIFDTSPVDCYLHEDPQHLH